MCALKNILKGLIAILIFIGSGIFIITTLFSEDIEKGVTLKLQQNMLSPLNLENVEFTIFDNFPYASVKFTNFLIQESNGFDNDTLLFAPRAYVEIGLINILRKNYTLKNIILADAQISLKYDSLNNSNFLVFKNPSSTEISSPLSINKITLKNTKININLLIICIS